MSPVNLVIQYLLVALLVAGSALYSTWRLMPLATRLKLLDRAAPLARGVAGAPLARLRSKVLAQLAGGGCGGCSAGPAHHRTVRR